MIFTNFHFFVNNLQRQISKDSDKNPEAHEQWPFSTGAHIQNFADPIDPSFKFVFLGDLIATPEDYV